MQQDREEETDMGRNAGDVWQGASLRDPDSKVKKARRQEWRERAVHRRRGKALSSVVARGWRSFEEEKTRECGPWLWLEKLRKKRGVCVEWRLLGLLG
ncbi:hypothetical protein PIB30_040870 [Stylosanthes scabra]|uniref:Uncharacterized protein n=1 Tax=Stylosanthes scabra TaxID=79078 RepID=A0ABU6SEM1_9FABA|nr:hypothetical protein [Stylosanthes scabra]